MPKKERMAIYEHLFKEGVMVAKKDFHAPKHPELESIQNLHVIKAMQVNYKLLQFYNSFHYFKITITQFVLFQSLKSRGFVKEQFAWRHYYWYLTNEGIRYLREFLHLPPEVSLILILILIFKLSVNHTEKYKNFYTWYIV